MTEAKKPAIPAAASPTGRLRPARLKSGDKILLDGRLTMEFIRRIDRLCVFRCEAFAGQLGPEDNGTCTLPDSQVTSRCQRVNP